MPRLSSILHRESERDSAWLSALRRVRPVSISTTESLLGSDSLSLVALIQTDALMTPAPSEDELQRLKQRVALATLAMYRPCLERQRHRESDREGEGEVLRAKRRLSVAPPIPLPLSTVPDLGPQVLLDLHTALSLSAQDVVPSSSSSPLDLSAAHSHSHSHSHSFTRSPRPTGCASLDALFCGEGLPAGHLVSILGDSQCGKSLLCMRAAVFAALTGTGRLGSMGQRVLFINSTNDFNPQLMKLMMRQYVTNLQMLYKDDLSLTATDSVDAKVFRELQAMNVFEDKSVLEEFFDSVLSRIVVNNCFNMWDGLDILSSIQANHRSVNKQNLDGKVSQPFDLIVIDCLHQWISPYLHDSSGTERVPFNATAMVVNVHPFISQMHLLMKSIAVESDTTILVTNVLNKEHLQYHRQRSFGPQSRANSVNNSMITNRLSIATGTGGPSHYLDTYDAVLLLARSTSASNNDKFGDVDPHTTIEIGVVVRQPYWKTNPMKASFAIS